MSFIKICSLVLKASQFLQGHLSATLQRLNFMLQNISNRLLRGCFMVSCRWWTVLTKTT